MNPSVLMLLATLATQAPAPTPTPTPDPLAGWTLSGTFEGYYQWNANQPPDRVNLFRAYDTRANTFSIQQAAIVLESAPDRERGRSVGLRLDLQFGQATEALQGSPTNEPRPEAYRNLWQAYGSYVFPGSHAVRMDFGKFGSSLGIETNYAKDNPNFSRAPVRLSAVLSQRPPTADPGHRQGFAELHADERHPADGGLQQLQVESVHG